MEYVIKTVFGYKELSEHEAVDYTHLILDRQEYQRLLNEQEVIVNRLKQDASVAITKMKKSFLLDRENRNQNHEKQIEELRSIISRLQESIDLLKNQVFDVETRYKETQNLNTNLLRIMRERSNQKRGLVPKKQHCGYVVQFSEQYVEKYVVLNNYENWRKSNKFADKADFKESEQRSVQVWRTMVQTPFDASMPISCLQTILEADLQSSVISATIGYGKVAKNHSNGAYNDFEVLSKDTESVLYKWTFRSNRKTGFWDVVLFTTKELTETSVVSKR